MKTRTILIIKPGAMWRRSIGDIISDIERHYSKFEIVGAKVLTFSRELAEKFYAEHLGKDFYERLIAHTTSGPSFAIVLEAWAAVTALRGLVGPSDPLSPNGIPGTLRKVYGDVMPDNAVHASDSDNAAAREIELLFGKELVLPVGGLPAEQIGKLPLVISSNATAWEEEAARKLADDIESECLKGLDDTVEVAIKLTNANAVLPIKATEDSAGWDVCAIEDFQVPPFTQKVCPLGFVVAIPRGYEIQVRSRSGLAAKFAISVLNSPGTIDSDYRGEVGVILFNNDASTRSFLRGDRIAQLVVAPVQKARFVAVEAIGDLTVRGTGGFGSTGR
jgi:dUTP pyrophosphatase